jgi:hypothetical protein
MSTVETLRELEAVTGITVDRGEPDWTALAKAAVRVEDAAWGAMSSKAQGWTNAGIEAINAARRDGGDPSIEPLPFPEVEATSEAGESAGGAKASTSRKASGKRGAAELRAAGGEAVGGGAVKSRWRTRRFRKGAGFYFVRYLLRMDRADMDRSSLAAMVRGYNESAEAPPIAEKSASVIFYDMLTVLRVMRDESMFTHPIVEDLDTPSAPE